jgi:hypothetical protein
VEIRESFVEECMKLQMPQRLAKIRRLQNLDDQYYYDDDDRLALSRVYSTWRGVTRCRNAVT